MTLSVSSLGKGTARSTLPSVPGPGRRGPGSASDPAIRQQDTELDLIRLVGVVDGHHEVPTVGLFLNDCGAEPARAAVPRSEHDDREVSHGVVHRCADRA